MGKNAVIADVKDSTGAPFNIYGLSKGDFVRCTLVIDKYGILRKVFLRLQRIVERN